MATNDNMNCVFCKNKTSGAHSCGICLKPCHAIPPCASSIEEKEEGFGAAVICGICAQGQKKPTSDSEDENLSDDIEEGSAKKKKKNCYSIDKKLEAIDYAKKHSMHETARHFNCCFPASLDQCLSVFRPVWINKPFKNALWWMFNMTGLSTISLVGQPYIG
jgi:hypothetical protein